MAEHRYGRGWASALGLGLALSSACYEGFDPLDPEVIAEVARSRGDAEGIELSGLYTGRFDPIECGCDEQSTGIPGSLCAAIDTLSAFGLADDFQIDLIQADGVVRVSILPEQQDIDIGGALVPTLYGPLSADGRISAAGVVQSDAVLLQGQVLGRIDGTLDDDGLVGEFQQRLELSADLVSGLDLDTVRESLDCRERIGFDLEWIAPPLVPIDPGDGG